MDNGVQRGVKSTQEQAVASWISYLNQMRLDELLSALDSQDINLENALRELAELKVFIGDPEHILGSSLTKHGEIAEHVQVNFSNARNLINGLEKEYSFEGVGRTAPEDYLKNGQQVQSKFYNGLKQTLFGKHALMEHLEKYDDFIKNGGSYDIPKDQYEEMLNLLDKYSSRPSQLSRSEYDLAKRIDTFLNEKELELGKDIRPADVGYKEVQQGTVSKTIDNEEKNIKESDYKNRKEAYERSKPTMKEGAKAAGMSAAVEGGMAFCMGVAKKRKGGKTLSEFTAEDWKEIGIETGKGGVKGGIRGGTIYVLTNFTATPANVASAYVTAVFGIISQAKAYEMGKISKEDFIINSEEVCLDVTVSAIASLAGQLIIPIPVLGAVIGNVAGEFIYEICKEKAGKKEQELAESYKKQMEELNQKLDVQYLKFVLEIQRALKRFVSIEVLAFDEDINKAFIGSVGLALEVGVDENLILKSSNDVDRFFLE